MNEQMTTDIPDDPPHVSELDPSTIVSLDYVRDDDTIYHVLPNHEGIGRYDLVEVEEANGT